METHNIYVILKAGVFVLSKKTRRKKQGAFKITKFPERNSNFFWYFLEVIYHNGHHIS